SKGLAGCSGAIEEDAVFAFIEAGRGNGYRDGLVDVQLVPASIDWMHLVRASQVIMNAVVRPAEILNGRLIRRNQDPRLHLRSPAAPGNLWKLLESYN